MSQAQKQKRYLRFSAFERVEHLVLIISFTTLAVTGLSRSILPGLFHR